MKKKAVILFNGPHFAYSPTTIGLYDLLSEYFDVTILADDPKDFTNEPLPNRKVVYINRLLTKTQYRIGRVLRPLYALFDKNLALLQKKRVGIDVFYEFKFIKEYLSKEAPDTIIAIDCQNLWYTQILNKKVEFLSLEIHANDIFYDRCDFENINSVIIQTKERYEHVFKNRKFKTFFIQNAPVFVPFPLTDNRKGLVYCGTAWDPFGFYHCLEFLRDFPDHTLTVKGALLGGDKLKVETDYADLIAGERLIIDSNYLDDNAILNYLRQFRIGFCFYNFESEWINTFNYFSAPSGKMFKYMAAGVPVIGQDILGLNPVKEFDCGILIKDLKPESIKQAIDKIENNFDYYSQNCLKAAQHYSFDKTSKSFINHLINQ